jgi:hypothetical protein
MKKQISGVYLVRNTVTNDKYIGSSVDILNKGWYLIEDYKEPDILNYYPEIDDKISIIGKIC